MEFITDFDQKKIGLDIIMRHYGKEDTAIYQIRQVDNVVILKLTTEEMTRIQLGNLDE